MTNFLDDGIEEQERGMRHNTKTTKTKLFSRFRNGTNITETRNVTKFSVSGFLAA